MVVITLIAIILALASINIVRDDSRRIYDEAMRLNLLLNSAREEAIFQGKVYLLLMLEDGYRFYRVSAEGEAELLAQDELLHPRQFDSGIRLLASEIEGIADNEQARIVLYPTGDISAFSLSLGDDDHRWYLKGEASGFVQTLTPSEFEALPS